MSTRKFAEELLQRLDVGEVDGTISEEVRKLSYEKLEQGNGTLFGLAKRRSQIHRNFAEGEESMVCFGAMARLPQFD
jgi:hypothetical protein